MRAGREFSGGSETFAGSETVSTVILKKTSRISRLVYELISKTFLES